MLRMAVDEDRHIALVGCRGRRTGLRAGLEFLGRRFLAAIIGTHVSIGRDDAAAFYGALGADRQRHHLLAEQLVAGRQTSGIGLAGAEAAFKRNPGVAVLG